MNWKRRYRCPQCGAKLKDFGLDLDAIEVQCPRCHAQFSPLQVFRDSDIVFFSQILPQDRQEAFLAGLGFEKQPVRRTPKPLLYGLLSLLIIGGLAFAIILFFTSEHKVTAIGPVIGSLLFCSVIYDYYKDEEKPRWRRRKE